MLLKYQDPTPIVCQVCFLPQLGCDCQVFHAPVLGITTLHALPFYLSTINHHRPNPFDCPCLPEHTDVYCPIHNHEAYYRQYGNGTARG